MSRRGGPVYEEREYYAREQAAPAPLPVRVRERDYDDEFYRRGDDRASRPDFLRDDYGRAGDAGPLVLRERDTETFSRVERRRSPSPLRARVTETRERIRERSPSPIRITRERERYVERERSPSPVDRVRIRKVEEVSRRPSPSPSPSPPPPPAPIRAPPIHQEIITHHRHIEHGFERARVPTPPPPPPAREETRVRETDIDIYSSRNHTDVDIRKSVVRSRTPQPPPRRERDYVHDDSYLYEKERDKLRVRDTHLDITRRRSVSARPNRVDRDRTRIDIRDNEEEADYYARKASDRAYIGEAYNGATKDWSIVDVPPGTERVRMDGVGGGSQEISWQKYNGVRRSKFIPERERERDRVEIRDEPRREATTSSTSLEIDISRRSSRPAPVYERETERIEISDDRRVGMPRGPKNRLGDLWTEITKDLVVREAIEELGYDFEETEYFYYIIQYLRYEDVLQLVQLSETIRRERQHRIREIEYEREKMVRMDRRRDVGHFDDERIVEREIIYDGRRQRRSGW